MTAALPTVFLSHGSPMLAVDGSAAHDFLKGLAACLPRPKNILAVSAHWETAAPAVSLAASPETIHDFGGFPDALYRLQYPAPGAPDLAARTAGLLEAAGFAVGRDPGRGLDHGAWVPLGLIYPDADIPVTQLAIQPHRGPAHHLALGRALRPLREEGTLILASGAVTHNLQAFFRGRFALETPPPDWVSVFADWIADAIAAGRLQDLLHYRERAPFAVENHPTDEHLLPLFVACGAAADSLAGEALHRSTAYGILAMDAYRLQ
jgi:4,5-DOPA dioxygenase extradiol